MAPTIAFMLVLLGVALVLFWTERLPPDLVALGLLLTLAITGLLPSSKVFAGFGSDVVVGLLGLLVMTAALARTGFVDLAGQAILRRTGDSPRRLVAAVTAVAAGLSSFVPNTAATAFVMPTAMGLARRARISPSRLLMPVAFGAILASSVTLVSTSTNLVVSGLMQQSGLAPLGMFELTPVGVPIMVAGVLYVILAGPRLVPDRASAGDDDPARSLKGFLTEVVVERGSRLAGRTLAAAGLGRDLRLTVLGLRRGAENHLAPAPDLEILEGDVLLLEGVPADLATLTGEPGLTVRHDGPGPLESADVRLAEAVVMPGSPLAGRRLRTLAVRSRYGVQVLAIRRHEEILLADLAEQRVRAGDLLLLQGERGALRVLAESEVLRLVGEPADVRPHPARARIAAVTFVASLALTSTGLLSFPVALLLGALVVMVSRCITPDEAYREIHWRSLVFIACMLGVGGALESTGTAAWLAEAVAGAVGTTHPSLLLAGVFAVTVGLTQPLSNQAAAAIVLPVALGLARELGQDPRPFAVIVAVAASCSFLTPLEPSCLMVYGPGRYRFSDFVRAGAPLTLIVGAIALVLVPWWWG